ncbi:hypothetical protein MYCTH_2296937 [Thermothelomyces thermophilus ATCC 42464]|uniref:Uncharacterized protein n=1 Tax=Thermothelomyces thermophilus (strain ATCC 42464 / BCRC 31852 / DSM 1799) TaxID=573729 RepID=G2Q3P6_THET4|nr:uncharacterized protein MYCTH_2296937 [Thermothelomyces thermophilus ATCC 42464]AEO54399.1 hypothetical protein MYCTH_2296937 [Thermothelomyces thermophilus ATCC 42464]
MTQRGRSSRHEGHGLQTQSNNAIPIPADSMAKNHKPPALRSLQNLIMILFVVFLSIWAILTLNIAPRRQHRGVAFGSGR